MSCEVLEWPPKHPDAKLDYEVNWSADLGSDTISSSVWTVEDAAGGCILTQKSFNDTRAFVWIEAGEHPLTLWVTNRIHTAGGRDFAQPVKMLIRE